MFILAPLLESYPESWYDTHQIPIFIAEKGPEPCHAIPILLRGRSIAPKDRGRLPSGRLPVAFLVLVGVSVAMFLLALFLKDVPLRKTAPGTPETPIAEGEAITADPLVSERNERE